MQALLTPQFKLVRTGVGLALVGMGVGMIQSVLRYLWERIKSRFFVSIDVDSKDDSFKWMLEWMSEHPIMRDSNRLGVETTYVEGGREPRVLFVPAMGTHRFTFNSSTLWISRSRESRFDMASGSPFETLTVTTFGRDAKTVRAVIHEAMIRSLKKEEGKTVIYTSCYGDWKRFGAPRPKRPLSSVILPDGVMEDIQKDLITFLNDSKWYRDRGIPYRRGYLLHGSPGSGKSSAIHALAGSLDLNICIVNLAQRDMSDEQLLSLLNGAPTNVILLLEDVDTVFIGREDADGSIKSPLTFSGLLNALDGVAAQEGRVVFMTTNRPHLLDPALIRDGRVDKKVHLGHATPEQARRLFAHFYDLDPMDPLSIEFARSIPNEKFSMARIQGYLMINRYSPKSAIENVNSLVLLEEEDLIIPHHQ